MLAKIKNAAVLSVGLPLMAIILAIKAGLAISLLYRIYAVGRPLILSIVNLDLFGVVFVLFIFVIPMVLYGIIAAFFLGVWPGVFGAIIGSSLSILWVPILPFWVGLLFFFAVGGSAAGR